MRPATGPLRVGIVGCGLVAEHVHLPVIRRLKELEVSAIADTDPRRLARVGDLFGVSARHASAEALLAETAVDAVAVLVPPGDHATPALAALAAGKHLFIEKPLALSLDDADRLVEAAARASGLATIGFNLRWLDLIRRARDLVRAGFLGEVETLHTVLTSKLGFGTDLPAWRRNRDLGGGSLIEQGMHHFDLWRYLLGSEVEKVFALAREGDAGAAITARATSGALIQTSLSERSTPTHSVEIFGTAGCARLRLTRFDGLELLPRAREDSAPAVRARGLAVALRSLPRAVAGLPTGGNFAGSYAEQWRRFAAATRRGEPVTPTLEDGRRALAISAAAIRSVSTGAPARVEPSPALHHVAADVASPT